MRMFDLEWMLIVGELGVVADFSPVNSSSTNTASEPSILNIIHTSSLKIDGPMYFLFLYTPNPNPPNVRQIASFCHLNAKIVYMRFRALFSASVLDPPELKDSQY